MKQSIVYPVIVREGVFCREDRYRFHCCVNIDGEEHLCYLPSNCKFEKMCSLKGRTVLLSDSFSKKSKFDYKVEAVKYRNSQMLLNLSFLNRVMEQELRRKKFSFLGERKNIILDTNDFVPQVSFIDREMIQDTDVEKGQMSAVDGQQRLTTNYKAYSNSDDFRNIVLDVARGRFLLVEGAFSRSQIPVGMLLHKEDSAFYDYLAKNNMMKDPAFMTVLVQCRSKIRSYYYTINQAENLSEDEQIEWFEVLNNAGSRVSALQMRFSKMKIHGIDIYTMYTLKFKNKLLEYGYDFFSPQKTSVSYPIAALNSAYEIVMDKTHTDAYAPIPSDTKENQLCAMEPKLLLKCFDMTLEALDKAIDFIADNKVEEPDRIDYINYLTGYFVYNPDVTYEQMDKLIHWYNNVDFNNKSNSRRRMIFSQLLELK